MRMKGYRKCSKCHEYFRTESLIKHDDGGPVRCVDCEEKYQKNIYFERRICQLHNLRKPGPYIWRDKVKLNRMGYTDESILNAAEYYIKVLGNKCAMDTLYYVTRDMVRRANEYFSGLKEIELEQEQQKEPQEIKLNHVEREENKPELIDLDNLFNDDDLGY